MFSEFISEGWIILNLVFMVIRNLYMGNEEVEFLVCFGGKVCNFYVLIGFIFVIYVKENGKGMFFDEDEILFLEN